MTESAAVSGRERFARPLFVGTIVIGSFLLFLTQPMIARMALPRVGGAPAVWNSAMLVYQALLLGGYAYAHWVGQLAPRKQAGLHLAAFALAGLWLPIGLRPDLLLSPDASPALWVPWFLLSSIGPLFFVVSAQAPLMQRWYALESARGEPYALYAASNLGSFAGLIAYPLLVEPLLPLHQQSLLWTAGYGLLVLLVAGCALTIPADAVEKPALEAGDPPRMRTVLHWVLLAAVPSGLMLSTTTHLTTDIVAMPLLWVLPLGLYLLSFVVAFAQRRGPAEFFTLAAPLIMLVTGALAFSTGSQTPVYSATMELLLLFVIAVALHGKMYALRPAPAQLTHFYLAMAVGGMIGGIFCAIVAPTIFDWTYEHPFLLLAAAFLLPQAPFLARIARLWDGERARWLVIAVPVVALLISVLAGKGVGIWSGNVTIAGGVLIILLAVVSIGRPVTFALCLAALMFSYGGWRTLNESIFENNRTRSYFGVYTVSESPSGMSRMLQHGTTLHGTQSLASGHERDPTTYYAPRSGVGLAMSAAGDIFGPKARIGVVGLGTGTLSCYAQPGQDWRFFEIDPAVVGIAVRSGAFTFMRRCAPQARVILGDARLSLAQEPAKGLDVLALDAFSSDAVPMHLLTREAFAVYARALRANGLLLVHVSNRYLDLDPVVAAAAKAGGWNAMLLDYIPTEEEASRHAGRSIWIALSRDRATMLLLRAASVGQGEWEGLDAKAGSVPWTDDYASILPLLKPLRFDFDLAP